MTQHLLFTLVAPPLLLAGIPAWLWQAVLRRRGVMPVAKVLVNPLVAFGVFNLLIVVTHLPHVVDYALREHWFHFVVHAALVTSALMMWWPVMATRGRALVFAADLVPVCAFASSGSLARSSRSQPPRCILLRRCASYLDAGSVETSSWGSS